MAFWMYCEHLLPMEQTEVVGVLPLHSPFNQPDRPIDREDFLRQARNFFREGRSLCGSSENGAQAAPPVEPQSVIALARRAGLTAPDYLELTHEISRYGMEAIRRSSQANRLADLNAYARLCQMLLDTAAPMCTLEQVGMLREITRLHKCHAITERFGCQAMHACLDVFIKSSTLIGQLMGLAGQQHLCCLAQLQVPNAQAFTTATA